MGELKIVLSDELERVFRKIAMKRFSYQKGAISAAAKEALKEWSMTNNTEAEEKSYSWDELEGIIKNNKKNSVELQHEAWKKIAKKHIK